MQYYESFLGQLKQIHLFRELSKTPVNQKDKAHYELLIDFSTNDYLGLAKSPALIQTSVEAVKRWGVGATGSRLLSGNFDFYEEFESEIALAKNSQAALIFNSGFSANLGVLSALLDLRILKTRPLVFFDRLNHNSLYMAVLNSGAKLVRYNHADVLELENLFVQYSKDQSPKFIVTETVFGMDGDLVDLKKIIELARIHKAFLYLDEAHATGMMGKGGYGMSTMFEMQGLDYIIMGTFSKALGSFGSYIATSNILKKYLINHCSNFIYTTALPPSVIAVARAAWKEVPKIGEVRRDIGEKAEFLRHNLRDLGIDTGKSCTNIIPIIIGEAEKALVLKDALLRNRIIVSAIRPPTVPPLTSRLRLAITANHTWKDLEKFLEILEGELRSKVDQTRTRNLLVPIFGTGI